MTFYAGLFLVVGILLATLGIILNEPSQDKISAERKEKTAKIGFALAILGLVIITVAILTLLWILP
ncbi:MAG: hypothetical protein AAB652_01070 [Patescibacteria group bacterium]